MIVAETLSFFRHPNVRVVSKHTQCTCTNLPKWIASHSTLPLFRYRILTLEKYNFAFRKRGLTLDAAELNCRKNSHIVYIYYKIYNIMVHTKLIIFAYRKMHSTHIHSYTCCIGINDNSKRSHVIYINAHTSKDLATHRRNATSRWIDCII